MTWEELKKYRKYAKLKLRGKYIHVSVPLEFNKEQKRWERKGLGITHRKPE